MAERDDLDRMLDAALSTYADPGPDLEARILARLACLNPSRTILPRHSLPWLIAVPALACALVVFLIWSGPSHPSTNRVAAPSIVTSSLGDRTAAAPPRQRSQRSRSRALPRMRGRVVLASVDRPKLDVFPTPQPLTVEEKGIIRIVTQTPTALRQALVASQRESGAPIHISEIQIPPFKPLSAGND